MRFIELINILMEKDGMEKDMIYIIIISIY